jgi:diguanylate cyclase
MNRNDTQIIHSNRPASRRLHRRLALVPQSACLTEAKRGVQSAQVVSGLPRNLVREAGMFELMAAEMRIAELEKALADAHAVALTDPLTGALNRRGFNSACEREMSRTRRKDSPLALVYIDLDDFKQLNDSLGHEAGDLALIHLVDLLQKTMRPSDVLGRFGGEEFVLMLPETALVDAKSVVARFLCEFSARVIPGTERVMTFSAGVVALANNESLDAALRRADAAIYAAKRAGKNCIVSR